MGQISIGGTIFLGRSEGGRLGASVALAGDLNGDGIDDFAFGAPFATRRDPDNSIRLPLAGEAVVVFGTGSVLPAEVGLENLDGSNGYVLIEDDRPFALLGAAIAGAGDLDGDGVGDLLFGAPRRDAIGTSGTEQGAAYLLHGVTGPAPAERAVAIIGTSDIWTETGTAPREMLGFAVAGPGDVNGDGIDDALIAIPGYSPGTTFGAGAVAVVFGSPDGPAAISDLDGTNGFLITGASALDQVGTSIAGAGDPNGDGISDILIGAPGVSAGGAATGGAYLIYGSAASWTPTVDLTTLGSHGVRIGGDGVNGLFGAAVAGLGDVTGDGTDDLAIGAPEAGGGGTITLIHGSGGGIDTVIEVAMLAPDIGTTFTADAIDGAFGSAIAGVGDVDGDGIGDFAAGAFRSDFAGRLDNGAVYLVFGTSNGFQASLGPASVDGANGYIFIGAASFDNAGASVSAAGDANGDGYADFLIGADGTNRPGATDTGAVYLIYGGPSRLAAQDALDGEIDGTIDLARIGEAIEFAEIRPGPITIRGSAGSDRIELTGNEHIILAGRGNDILLGGAGNDELHAAYGDDTVFGGAGDDTLLGWRGTDTLAGGPDRDILHGGPDDDILDGGPGDDILTGGSGSDSFVFRQGFGDDHITDFVPIADRLDFATHSAVLGLTSLTLAVIPGGTQILDGLGNSIRIDGVVPEDLGSESFIF